MPKCSFFEWINDNEDWNSEWAKSKDRFPYPADQVLIELQGSFGFLIYDNKDGTVFVASGSNGQIVVFWGIAADGLIVISENLELIKVSCAKSFAPFPT
ncbi:hypothetical protein PIB30_100147, partial [Stylosanthes scabra]|nr:hypothetical protein [Stylosanthes scabra]